MDSPTSKPFSLSSIMKMSEDHQSVRPRWSSPLRAICLVSHGNFLGLLRSWFVFSITSHFPADAAADVLLKVSTVTAG